MANETDMEKVRAVHPNICSVLSELWQTTPVVFDENSGAAVVVSSKQWYNKFGLGGTGMAKVVTIFHPDQSLEHRQYTWRDQYDPSRDCDYNSIRRVAINSASTKEELVLDAETAAGERTLRYTLRR
ncbi:hypothetical protein COU57_05610 [Candidatus Pacearchaeota archaeon CG10_big_fil_rev_8_21_14_0_10_32_14]|nr:MAG: hypothetical protein COU57_05610 [Candidatus Pacearchaeota archaeon CG10_big_fil_rev_8_21_14_0_10_32_14]